MRNSLILTEALKIATDAIRIKRDMASPEYRRKVCKELHLKQTSLFEKEVEDVVSEFIQNQIKEVSKGLKKVETKGIKFNPNHDPHTGQFTSGPAGSVSDIRNSPKKFRKPYGKPESQTVYDTSVTDKWKSDYPSKLTEDQKQAVKDYSEHGFGLMNSYLRGNHHFDKESDEKNMVAEIEKLDSAMVGYLSKNVKVYRASTETRSNYKDDSFVSTTGDISTAEDFKQKFGGRIQEIVIPAGTKVAYVSSLNKKGEDEILLPRGGEFKKKKLRDGSFAHIYTPPIEEKSFQSSKAADTILSQVFNPQDENSKLINVLLPVMAKSMAKAIRAELLTVGVDILKVEKSVRSKNILWVTSCCGKKLTDCPGCPGPMTLVKASTASEWLDEHGHELESQTFDTPHGKVDMGFLTEYPEWAKQEIRTQLSETFKESYWKDIHSTTFNDIQKVMDQGLVDGWSINRIADELMELGSEYTKSRARNIARTESGNALNGARKAAHNQLFEEMDGVLPMKESWLSILGSTTRDSHADLDGVPADEDGLWLLGGIRVPWPGHRSLPANERCNCQCTTSLEFGMRDSTAQELIQEYFGRMKSWKPMKAIRTYSGIRIDIPLEKHLQGQHSQQSHGGGGGGSMQAVKKDKKGKFVQSNGKPLPDHIPTIPPAWTNVKISMDKDADLLVKGKDKKGRNQSIYSANHTNRQAAKKFSKVNELRSKKDEIRASIRKDMKSDHHRTRENAACLALIEQTGLRPGSTRETGAEKKAYGATTLLGKHIKTTGNKVKLQFTGKKGVSIDIEVKDPAMKKMLKDRKKAAGPNNQIFDTNDRLVAAYAKTKDGGKFTSKDFRTAKGTDIAIEAMKGIKAPKTKTAYKKAVKQVATTVSKQLGNTPTVALQSYIDPTVFSKWRVD